MALPFPGLPLEYFDGDHWQPVDGEILAEGVRAVRARSADGRRAGRAVELALSQPATAQR
ncbi:chitobiase/beta-hexosaminidase C-terminal domain-containing protein [Microbulbifer taiwanensis]